MAQTPSQPLLVVSAPPFWHCGRTVQKMQIQTLVALVPAMVMAVWHWGIPAARVMALAVCTGVLVEVICRKIMRREVNVDDFSAVVSCLLFSFLMPAASPWWLVMLGAALCMTLGKAVFGSFGSNPLNTAVVGWALLYVSWPVLLDPNATQLLTPYIDPLVRLKYYGAAAVGHIDLLDLIKGAQINGLGAGQVGALFVGGCYLAVRGVIRWEITASFLVGITATAAVFNIIDPQLYATPAFHLCTGSTMLGAFFLATEPATAPDRNMARILYGLVGGVLVIIIRHYGIYTDGVPFAILLINLLAPQLDLIRPRPFGGK